MLMALIPLFDEALTVKAYSVFTQKDNYFINPMKLGTGVNDGAARVEGLELIEAMGLETLSDDKIVFVPLNNLAVFSEVEEQCSAPHDRIVFLIDSSFPPVEMYVNRLKELKNKGYRLAMRKLAVSEFERYREILQLMDYMFLNNKKIAIDKAKIYFNNLFPDMILCAGNIDTMERFEQLKQTGGYQLYEGDFYRMPVTKGVRKVESIKSNYLQLLNLVNQEDFDSEEAARIIGQDAALTISLLKMVNRMTVYSQITTLRHAVAMLGQRELRKWINTVVVNELYADKPGELTRLSMLRAKFSEELANVFGLKEHAEELFLMGLFSLLDVIFEKSMEEALEMVIMPENVKKAILHQTGILAPVYQLILQYEVAHWEEVSRQLVLADMNLDEVNLAYERALSWYKEIL